MDKNTPKDRRLYTEDSTAWFSVDIVTQLKKMLL